MMPSGETFNGSLKFTILIMNLQLALGSQSFKNRLNP